MVIIYGYSIDIVFLGLLLDGAPAGPEEPDGTHTHQKPEHDFGDVIGEQGEQRTQGTQ